MRGRDSIRIAFIAATLWIVGSFAASMYATTYTQRDEAALSYRECMNSVSTCDGAEIWHDQYNRTTCTAKFRAEEACETRFVKEAAEQRKQQAINAALGLVVKLLVCFIAWRAMSASAARRAWRAASAFASQPRAHLKNVPPQMKRNIIIAMLAFLWIAANAAHAYTFFHGSASNLYVKCITEYALSEERCGDAFSEHRDRFEHDRLGVTLKSTLNAMGLAVIACLLGVVLFKTTSLKRQQLQRLVALTGKTQIEVIEAS